MSQDKSYVIQTLHTNAAGIAFNLPEAEGYVVGRSDVDYLPDIDLASYGAREHGVSRRHCALVQYRGELHLVDLSSVNGSFVNGKRLPPEGPFKISPGDEIRLGTLELILLRKKD